MGGVAYLRPTQVAATLPPVVTAASGTEWRRQGFHLIPQVPLRVQACRCSVSLFLPLKLVCQSEQVLARCISHNQLFLGWSFLVPLHLNINSAHPPPPPPPPPRPSRSPRMTGTVHMTLLPAASTAINSRVQYCKPVLTAYMQAVPCSQTSLAGNCGHKHIVAQTIH